MSLTQRDARAIHAYVNSILSDPGTPKLVAGGSSSGTGGLAVMMDVTQGGGMVYLVSRDRLYALLRVESTQHPAHAVIKMDPFFLKTSPPDADWRATSSPNTDPFYLRPGQYDPASGAQNLYTANSGISGNLRRVHPDTLVISGDFFTAGPNGAFNSSSSDVGSGVDGYFSALSSNFLVFEGLKNGIAGETLATGANVYPDGLYLNRADCRLAGVTRINGWVWVDIRTRRSVGRLGGYPTPTLFPCKVVATPGGTEDQTEQPIAGDEFNWCPQQYIPDNDATFAAPKGQLFFTSDLEIPTRGSPAPGDICLTYVRLTDFNPLGVASVAGIPTRTHGRVRFTSRLNMQLNPHFGLAGQDGLANGLNEIRIAYDVLRQRIICALTNTQGTPDPGTAGTATIGVFGFDVTPTFISSPAARDVPRTDGIADFEVAVEGDLAEPVPGVTVNFALNRRSTRNETVTVTGGPASTSTLGHFPVDTRGDGTPELAITADGVLLALTTDYTFVAATGVVTWVTDQQGKVVRATYNHRSVATTPAHGELLTSSAVTDENGLARAQVQYEDDVTLVGQLDALQATF